MLITLKELMSFLVSD